MFRASLFWTNEEMSMPTPTPKPGRTPTYPAPGPEDSFLDCSLSPPNSDDIDVDVDPDPVQRDPALWFEDGNVVVIAQNTAFRFHKGVLALHSQVFRDLFSVPQPPPPQDDSDDSDAAQRFDGCPVVHVTDTSYDFRTLLRELYCGGVT